jgi:hypothetical protein
MNHPAFHATYTTGRRRSFGGISTSKFGDNSGLKSEIREYNTDDVFIHDEYAPTIVPPQVQSAGKRRDSAIIGPCHNSPVFASTGKLPKSTVRKPTDRLLNRDITPDSDPFDIEGASIEKRQIPTIKNLGTKGWFDDNIVRFSLQVLAAITDCESHKIAFADPAYANDCYWLPMNHKEGDQIRDNLLKDKFRDKDFIFLPINDAYKSEVQSHRPAGLHWSLLVIDCRNKRTIKGSYFDSILTYTANIQVAHKVFQGACFLLKYLGSTATPELFLLPDTNMPQQVIDNRCPEKDKEGGSACGPFMWAAAKELVLYIIECREENCEIGQLEMTLEFRRTCNWDSQVIRTTIHH